MKPLRVPASAVKFPPMPLTLGEQYVLSGGRTACYGKPLPIMPYTMLAKRLFVSPAYAKRLVYMVGYGGGDPWERHLVKTEIDAAFREQEQCRN